LLLKQISSQHILEDYRTPASGGLRVAAKDVALSQPNYSGRPRHDHADASIQSFRTSTIFDGLGPAVQVLLPDPPAISDSG